MHFVCFNPSVNGQILSCARAKDAGLTKVLAVTSYMPSKDEADQEKKESAKHSFWDTSISMPAQGFRM